MNANETMRRAVLALQPSFVLGVIDQIDLRHGKIAAVVAAPLRSVQQSRDVASFANVAPLPAVRGLLEVMSYEGRHKVVEQLGDHAENPTLEQLREAVTHVEGDGLSRDDLLAVLAFAVGEKFPAAPQCLALIEERHGELPTLSNAPRTSVSTATHVVDDATKEARRARREAAKAKKNKPSTGPAPYKKKSVTPQRPSNTPAQVVAPLPEVRREIRLTPLEQQHFSIHHPLAGWVVVTEVPFDGVDPEHEDMTSKERPVLVVAASDEAILARPLYSAERVGRQLFGAWKRLLEKPSYLSDSRLVLDVNPKSITLRVGQLTDHEWNQTF